MCITVCGSCRNLNFTAEGLGRLTKLDLSHNSVTGEALQMLGYCTALTDLQLKRCSRLTEVPESIGQLSALQFLNLSRCKKLKQLPEAFTKLRSLVDLNLSWCQSLRALPTEPCLPQLTSLMLAVCVKLQHASDVIFSSMNLMHLTLEQCEGLLTDLQGLSNLPQLQKLHLLKCAAANSLTALQGPLTALTELSLSHAPALPCLLDQASALKWLLLSDSTMKSLRFQDTEMPARVERWPTLLDLHLEDCKELEMSDFPLFRLTQDLTRLYISGAVKLTAVPAGLGSLTKLKVLSFCDCTALMSLRNLKEVRNSKHLRALSLWNSSRLALVAEGPDTEANKSVIQGFVTKHRILLDCRDAAWSDHEVSIVVCLNPLVLDEHILPTSEFCFGTQCPNAAFMAIYAYATP